MTADVVSPQRWGIFLCAVLLLCGEGATASRAQSIAGTESPGASLRLVPLVDSVETERGEGRIVPQNRGAFALGRAEGTARSFRFGRALAGSVVGVAAGTGLGLLLWRGAAAEGFGNNEYDRPGDDDPTTADILFGAGLFAIAAGGPIGAVEGAGIKERRTDAYVVATIGEVVLGGLGYGLIHQLDGGPGGQLAGLSVGAALGAAAGTALVASQGPRGAVAYRNGSWRVAPPDVRVRPALATDRSPSIRVTLVSVRL